MLVLGIDPGTRHTGYGIVSKQGSRLLPVVFGVISPGGRRPLPERLRGIHDDLGALIAEHGPEVMALEEAFYSKNVRSAMRIGEARAIAILCAAEAGIPVVEYTPAVVKKAAVGSGRAHKSQVQVMVQRILGLAEPPASEDAADALAVAICHCNRARPDPA